MKSFFLRVILAVICVLCVAQVQPALAFDDDLDSGLSTAATTRSELSRKTTGWFRRPAKHTAQEQMQFANSLRLQDKTKKAMNQYYALVAKWPHSPEAATAQLAYAELMEVMGSPEEAFKEYQYLVDFYLGQFSLDDVLEQQLLLARKVMNQKHMGMHSPERALPLLEQIVKNGPRWAKAAEARFRIGVINETNGDYSDAATAFGSLRTSMPDSPFSEEAAFRYAGCMAKLIDNAPRSEPAYREALAAYSSFIRDYPRSTLVEDARRQLDYLKEQLANMYFERAEFYDKISKKPASALIAYQDFVRNFPTSKLATKAKERIDALSEEMEKKNED